MKYHFHFSNLTLLFFDILRFMDFQLIEIKKYFNKINDK